MPPCEEIRQQAWFVIAAYNEASVIRAVVSDVRPRYSNAIVVDDVDAMLDVLTASDCDIVLGSRFCGTTENLPKNIGYCIGSGLA